MDCRVAFRLLEGIDVGGERVLAADEHQGIVQWKEQTYLATIDDKSAILLVTGAPSTLTESCGCGDVALVQSRILAKGPWPRCDSLSFHKQPPIDSILRVQQHFCSPLPSTLDTRGTTEKRRLVAWGR